jgi:hypothetical protein
MFLRENRIHHNNRLKNKRKYYYHRINNEKQLGKLLHTTQLCSCNMCGNPRKYFNRLTLEEIKNKISFKEYLLEIN